MHHSLKMHPEYFAHAWHGHKPFEIRYNDRKYKTGDTVLIMEFHPVYELFGGKAIYGRITVVMANAIGVKDGFIVFLYDEISRFEEWNDVCSFRIFLESTSEEVTRK